MLEPGAIAVLAGAPAAVAGWLVGRKKIGAEAESIAVRTMQEVIRELRQEVEAKERELEKMRQRLDLAEAALEKITMGEAPPHLS